MAHLFNKGIYYIENGTDPNTLGLVPTNNAGLAKTEDGISTWRYDDALPTNKWVLETKQIHTNGTQAVPYTGVELPTTPGVNIGDTNSTQFNDGTVVNYTWDGVNWIPKFLESLESEDYSYSGNISQPFTSWTYSKSFANGIESNITHWDVTSTTAKHKSARRIAGYSDRLALAVSLDKDKLYRVDFEVIDYVSGSIAVNVGESFTFNASADGSYTDYVKTSSGDFIALQSFGADLTVTNVVVREVITSTQNFFGKVYSRDGIKTDGYIETGANKRIMIGSWDNGTNFQDDGWQTYENTQPSISIGYNSMTRGTGVVIGPNAGRDNTDLGYITAFGINTLRRNTTGHSTGFGTGAGQNNTTGNIAAFGDECLSNAVSTDNNGFGYYTLNLTTGNFNSAFGHEAGRLLTVGSSNTIFGYRSLYGPSNATGDWNCTFGANTLYAATSAAGNVAIGYNSMTQTTSGGFNVGIGFATLSNNTIGNNNTGVGQFAMRLNTSGNNNTAFGSQASRNNLTGEQNTAIGFNALYSNLNSFNVGIGSESLSSLTSGTYNTSLGVNSGRKLVDDNDNTISNNSLYIGSDTRSLANNQTNEIVIGYGAFGSGTNTVTLGNDNITQTNLKGAITFKTQFATSGSGVANGSLFYGTDGALYYKGGAGTVTQIAAN